MGGLEDEETNKDKDKNEDEDKDKNENEIINTEMGISTRNSFIIICLFI